MDQTLSIIKNSFLKPLLDKGQTVFEYANDVFYSIGVQYRKIAEMQPSKELLLELINDIAKTKGLKFDSFNPYLNIKNSYMLVTAVLDPVKNDDLYVSFTITRLEDIKKNEEKKMDNMKQFNFFPSRGEKVLQDLNDYVKYLISSNEKLQEELNNYNKDEEIQKLKNEVDSIRRKSLVIMSEKEKKDAETFSGEHYYSCKSNVKYILEGTGIGTSITVKCRKCQKTKDITDYETW